MSEPTPDAEPRHDAVYTQLLRFRRELRTFLRWSEQTAGSSGLTPAVHQLMLAVRGNRHRRGVLGGLVGAAVVGVGVTSRVPS
ncbi:MAG TPA: hypothetical protein VLR26_02095 [Frankiaceae bacterium]|nr:hypothetical protein [Frankiaceae bacterium]